MHWRHARANREEFASDARRDIEHLKRGTGQPRYLDAIRQIDAQQETTP